MLDASRSVCRLHGQREWPSSCPYKAQSLLCNGEGGRMRWRGPKYRRQHLAASAVKGPASRQIKGPASQQINGPALHRINGPVFHQLLPQDASRRRQALGCEIASEQVVWECNPHLQSLPAILTCAISAAPAVHRSTVAQSDQTMATV